MKLKNLLLLFAILALLTGASGCIFSPDDGDPVDPPDTGELDPATTPDKLLENFKTIYEDMLYEEYESMLHGDYRTVLLQSTFDEWAAGDTPLDNLYFDKNLETQIHRNMFDGLVGVGPGGEPIPPIDSINVDLLEKDGTWEPVEAAMDYFGGFEGAYMARFNVLIYFNNPDQHRYEVDQAVDFIAIPIDGIWYMLGQIGQENPE